ncbi:MAG TPA: proton-conducting transporter membrane subunit [Thermoanaerobaculia bacterium]|nr:proton-conducting transporter membrane subunit [Thermoanaerobaculia bacterium]
MLTLLVMSIVALALSGLPALLWRSRASEEVSTLLVILGAAGGLTAAIATLASGRTSSAAALWQLPNALLAVRLDPLSAAFLLPILILGVLTSVYGLAYWPARERASAGRVRLFMGLLLAGMTTVVIAAHAMLFLVAWETMAMAAFFLIATEDDDAEARKAAWIYLIATHAGTLALLALFVLMRGARGTFLIGPIGAAAGLVTTSAILFLALAGFGFKAGIVPLHFWLPGAHANGPSHVSALLSGAMLKVGVYGILRVLLLLPRPPVWWGGLLVGLGLISAVVAITLAITQSDMKRVLAYSSIENVGVIIVAIGLSSIGRATGAPILAALGLAAAVAHVWSHSLFKGLLFLGAGSVLHATGTRRIDAMGGLLSRMPVTGNVFFIGAAAASVLPGTNAFASEALLYFGLVSAAPRGSIVTLAAAIVALVGALAVACFVRLAGAVFLGAARTDAATHAHEAPLLMRAPLVILATACIVLGLFPAVIAGALETITGSPGVVAPFLHAIALPLQLGAVAITLALAVLLAATRHSPRRATWDCGYARPTARMQYTARSLSEWFTTHLTPRFFRPAARTLAPSGLYPEAAAFAMDVDEPFADRLLQPLAARWAARAMRLRWLQQGRLSLYLLYIFFTLIVAVAWVVAFPYVARMSGAGR